MYNYFSEFLITEKKIMILQKDNIVVILIKNRKILLLEHITYTFSNNSNFIFFGQL